MARYRSLFALASILMLSACGGANQASPQGGHNPQLVIGSKDPLTSESSHDAAGAASAATAKTATAASGADRTLPASPAPASLPAASGATVPAAKPTPGQLVEILQSPHRIHWMAAVGEQVFWTHFNGAEGFKSEGAGLSKASVAGGPSTLLFEGFGGDAPDSHFALTTQWLYATSNLQYWDQNGKLWRIPVSGGPRAELTNARVNEVLADEQHAVWTENTPDTQEHTIRAMAHGAASRVLATFPGGVLLKALNETEVFFTTLRPAKSGKGMEATLHALSLANGSQRVVISKFEGGSLVLTNNDLLFATPRGQLLAHPMASGKERVLLGRGGSCGAVSSSTFAVAEGYLYWTDRDTLNRCPTAGGKAVTLTTDLIVKAGAAGIQQIVVSEGRILLLKSGMQDRIYRYDLP